LSSKRTLFDLVVPAERLNPDFEHLRTFPGDLPARWMFDDVYQSFADADGNFLEQFQTTGFNARCFELYLFAYFSRSGFTVNRTHQNPDFIVSRDGLTAAIEATTVNPSTSGILAKLGKRISDLSADEMREYQRHELPIRFGSPLFSKLQAKYWELTHCQNMPFVIAIEAFHDDEALGLTDSALAVYLFGLEQKGARDETGKLQIETSAIKEHLVGDKTVPSNFFEQPGAENVSAIIFTNSGTFPKFSRMGYQHGIGTDIVNIIRTGFCFNSDPDAVDPTLFSYTLDEPPLVESWGQGMVVLHNPKCLRPLPREYFVDAVQGYLEKGVLKFDHTGWHPFASKTFIIHLGDVKKEVLKKLPQHPRVGVHSIGRDEFQALSGIVTDASHPLFDEQGWFADETESFLGTVVRDKVDDDWGYVVLARDKHFRFRAIETDVSMKTRQDARRKLQLKIAELLSSGQRIFDQDN
jgi:hypothetical protein